MSMKVDVGFVGFRATPVETPSQGRGGVQFSVFNPLQVTRSELQKIKVYTNNITLMRIDKDLQYVGKQPRFTLVKTRD